MMLVDTTPTNEAHSKVTTNSQTSLNQALVIATVSRTEKPRQTSDKQVVLKELIHCEGHRSYFACQISVFF